MTTKNKIVWLFDTSGSNKVKHIAIHPRKDWVGIINMNNTYSLWNYKEMILIKSFNCASLDENKSIDFKESLFYDRYSLPKKKQVGFMRNNIIFVSPSKISFYDYVTDINKSVSEKELEQKSIRKVVVYSETKICIVLNDGSFKVLDTKGLYSKEQEQQQVTVRTFKGYHTKPITWIFTYSQNINDVPRVITVSAADGLMACWNVDTMLHSAHDSNTPSFKFIMSKGNRNDSNNGQQIYSLQYNPSSYHLVTYKKYYKAIWSTMTGMELKRVRNTQKLKEIIFFNHFSAGVGSFIGHSYGKQLKLLKCSQVLQLQQIIDLRNFTRGQQPTITSLKSNPEYPAYLYITTNSSIMVMQIDKFYQPAFGIHNAFLTKLTTLNNKNYLVKSDKQAKNMIKKWEVQKLQFPVEKLLNYFYLSFDGSFVSFNLLQIKIQSMLHQQHSYKFFKIDDASPLLQGASNRTYIYVSYDAREFILFNQAINYFESYQIATNNDLISSDSRESIDFYCDFVQNASGYCRNIVWHQFKLQFAAICGFDSKGQLVSYIQQKKGFFSKGKAVPKLSGNAESWRVCIFEKMKNSSQYVIVKMSPTLNTKTYRLFNFGSQFAYSTEKDSMQILLFIDKQKAVDNQIQGAVVVPQKIFVSFCETFQVLCYDGYFVIYMVQQNGCFTYFRSVQQTVLQGYFWEKFFFFITKTGIYFLQILHDTLIIQIASNTNRFNNEDPKVFEAYLHEDLEPVCHLMLEGQLQIGGILNFHLLVLNQSGLATFISLKQFPYIIFCIQISSGYIENAPNIFKKSSQQIQQLMKQTLLNYGLILSDIMN